MADKRPKPQKKKAFRLPVIRFINQLLRKHRAGERNARQILPVLNRLFARAYLRPFDGGGDGTAYELHKTST